MLRAGATASSNRVTPSAGAEDTAARVQGPTLRHINPLAGYGFSYPAGWELERSGAVSQVSSRDGRLVVSFALGPVGLPTSYEGFESLLVSTYDDVDIAEVDADAIDGRNTVVVTGSATADAGPIDFRALLVEREGAPSVGAFAASDVGAFDPRLNEVLGSLRF